MKKILYLGTNRLYINKNMEVVTSLMKSVGDTYFYGPGYSTHDDLEKGVRDFAEKFGPFDFVFIDSIVLFSDLNTGQDNPLKGSYNYFAIDTVQKTYKDMVSFYLNPKGAANHRIFYPNFDPYNMTSQVKDRLEMSEAYLFTRDPKFWLKKEEMADLKQEAFADKVNDRWVDFISSNKQRIISFHGTVMDTDFRYHPIEEKEFDVGVFGVEYFSRKIAIKNLDSSNYKISKQATGYRRKLKSFLFRSFRSRELLSLYQDSFQRSIEDTKMAYTCGSALGYAIRKFVEIPSKGTLLLCKPFKGFNHAGYVNNLNCIVLEPENINEVVEEMLQNPKELQKIAKAGQAMVLEKHSYTTRLKQADLMLDRIQEGTFRGTEWINGELNFL